MPSFALRPPPPHLLLVNFAQISVQADLHCCQARPTSLGGTNFQAGRRAGGRAGISLCASPASSSSPLLRSLQPANHGGGGRGGASSWSRQGQASQLLRSSSTRFWERAPTRSLTLNAHFDTLEDGGMRVVYCTMAASRWTRSIHREEKRLSERSEDDFSPLSPFLHGRVVKEFVSGASGRI